MIQARATPNPNAMKFTASRKLVEGASRTYSNAADAQHDVLAGPLFALPGVASVFMVDDFVTVIKTADASWQELVPAVTRALEQALA